MGLLEGADGADPAHDHRGLLGFRVEVPPGVDPSSLRLRLCRAAFSEVENDWSAPIRSWAPNARGEVSVAASDLAGDSLEATGPGIRRARFPVPTSAGPEAGVRHVLHLDQGWATSVRLFDAETRAPLAGALVGPVVPGVDAPANAAESAYPFFVRSGSDGVAVIEGLLPACSYLAPISAPGHVRVMAVLRPEDAGEAPADVALLPGGLSVAGYTYGLRSLDPKPGLPLHLESAERGPTRLYIVRRSDERGRFEFGGLPEGDYRLAPMAAELGVVDATAIALRGGEPVSELALGIPEGAAVGGRVVDIESGEPIAGAGVRLGPTLVYTDADGTFLSQPVLGPWPLTAKAERADYLFETEDQIADLLPLRTENWSDLFGVELRLRRRRALLIERLATKGAEAAERAMLEVFGPEGNEATDASRGARPPAASSRVSLRDNPSAVPITSAGVRWLFARDAAGLVSDFVSVVTELDATTTTVELVMAPGAGLRGSLRYGDGSPVSGARIEVARVRADSNRLIEWLQVDPDPGSGNWSAAMLPPGEVVVRARSGDGQRLFGERSVRLQRGASEEVTFTVEQGLDFTGVVTNEEDERLREIPVVLYAAEAGGGPRRFEALTDEKGVFKFAGLAGPVVDLVSIDHIDYAPFRAETIALPAETLQVRLAPRAAIRVQAEAMGAGETVHLMQGQLRASELAPEQWYYEQTDEAGFDASGTALLRPRFEGRLRIVASLGGRWVVSPAIEWSQDSATLDITLSPGCAATLEVRLEGIDDEAAAGAVFDLINTALPLGAALESNPERHEGRLNFRDIPAGEYLLLGTTTRLEQAAARNIDIACGATAQAKLDFGSGGGVVAGRVIEAEDGAPIAGATVQLYFGDIGEPELLDSQSTGSDGDFRFEPLPAGRRYLLIVTHEQRRRQATTEADGAGLELAMAPEATVSVRIDADRRAVAERAPGVPFLFRAADASSVVAAHLGDLDAVRLAPGDYEVFWGEQRIGRMTVSANGGVAEIVP